MGNVTTETGAPTLTEFLLARVAEDEAQARTEQILRNGFPYYSTEATAFERHLGPARVLADCEAKRRIVAAFQLRDEQGRLRGGEVFGYHATGLAVAIRCLAEAYADHPDYRAEWRR